MMAPYFAMRIMKRKLKFSKVISVYPELEDDIREILILEGQDGLLEK